VDTSVGAGAAAEPAPVPLDPVTAPAERTLRAAGMRHFAGAKGLAVNGGALVINVLAAAVTGLGFWILAARVAPPEMVAQASAATGAILAVVSLSQQSFVLTLPSLLASSPEPRRLALQMYRYALVMTAIVSPLYVIFGPLLADGLDFLHERRLAALFIVGTVIWSIFSLQDAVLTGVRKSTYVLFENATWGTVRLVGLLLLWAGGVGLGVAWLVASWILPAAALVAVVTWYLFVSDRSPLGEGRGTQVLSRKRFLSYMGAEWLGSVLNSGVTLVTGAYVLTTLGAADAAPLLTAASLVVVVEGALASFAQALSVEASTSGAAEKRRSHIRLTWVFLGALSLGAVGGAYLFGEHVMALLGPHYRESGGVAMAILMLAVPFRSIQVVSNADNRIRGEGGRNLTQHAVGAAVCFLLLASGLFTTVAGIAWALVIMRGVTSIVSVLHLRRGGLHATHHAASA
jgi:O-antigen/teichoic acid export membrane protein